MKKSRQGWKIQLVFVADTVVEGMWIMTMIIMTDLRAIGIGDHVDDQNVKQCE